MIQCEVEIIEELPKDKIKQWEDKVVYMLSRKTLDFTDSNEHFPYLTGKLAEASMNEGVIQLGNLTYGLGARGVEYAPKVWQYGENTNWTNKKTLPQWYMSVFEKYKNEILQDAIKTSINEVK